MPVDRSRKQPFISCHLPHLLCSSPQASLVFLHSVQSLSRVRLFATPWTAAHQASLSITNPRSLLKLMSVELVMPSRPLILCCPLLLPSVFPRIKVFSNAGALSPLFSSSILGAYRPFSVLPFCLLILFLGFSRQEYWSGSPSPPPVDHILSDLSTATRARWVAPQGTAHRYMS